MNLQVDRERLALAYQTARTQLLAERNSASHWTGELSSSPLSTATAISALVLAEQGIWNTGLAKYTPGEEPSHVDEIFRADFSELVVQSLRWLAEQQNEDGGWGDTDCSLSNIATTMLVLAAFHLTGVPAKFAGLLERADHYVEEQGGLAALKQRYEGDKTFVVPILANCALADMVSWRRVPSLPFELACVPQKFYHRLHLPVVSYAIPALVAVGQARFYHAPPRNPLMRWIRSASLERSLEVLESMQPESGGFLEAAPLTSFVVMSLASIGMSEHPVTRRGVEFLLSSVRPDGSWPIDSNLATWNTSQALEALVDAENPEQDYSSSFDWLLGCQHRLKHPFTGAEPGGWGWTDLPGAVPDADDTAAAVLSLCAWEPHCNESQRRDLLCDVDSGINWLIKLQNKDGGWPTFCKGWGRLPFDRSSSDITAHVLRALQRWRKVGGEKANNQHVKDRISSAVQSGVDFLERRQKTDGSWYPLWFGNQHHPEEANPVYGTAKVLLMYDELGWRHKEAARRGVDWLIGVQHASGGWGVTGSVLPDSCECCSVEETALAVDALLPFAQDSEEVASSVDLGLSWLVDSVLNGQWTKPSPIGFYFAKLWYHERLYPQIFATRALASACRVLSVTTSTASVTC